MKRFFAVLLVAALLLSLLPAAAMAAKYATVVGGWLRLRSAANFNATTITSYYTGTEVEILGTTGGWYKVRTPDGRTGYMYGQYLKVGSSSSSSGSSVGNAYVTSHNGYGVRMRTGPGTGYRVIRTYDVGTPVTVLQSGSYWSKISVNGTVGYMMTQFLTYGSGSSSSDSVVCYATIWSRNGYGVRLRSGPSKNYGTIGTYSVGTTVAVLEKGSTWDKIRVGSRVGYMMNEFLDYHSNNEVTSVTLNNYRPAVGTVLSVQAISPSKATVSYEWRVNGTTKGTASTYTVTAADVGYQIQLKVTGTGSYTGSAKSAKTDAVLSNTQLNGLGLTPTAPVVGNTLTATVTPANATVLYAWIVGDSQVSNASTYTVKADDVNKVIKLIVTGTGNYSGSLTASTSAVTASGTLSGVAVVNTTNTASGAAPAVDDVLSASTSPSQAVATYQWQANGADIAGATAKTLKLTSDHVGKTISVKATAAAPYVGGTVASSSTAAVIAKPVAPTITTTTLPNGEKGTAYSQALQASGSTPITWSVSSGSTLPAGLALNAENGVLSGTPEASGTFSFTVKVTNAAMQSDTQDLTLVIADPNPAAPKLEMENVTIALTEGYTPAPVNIVIKNTGTAAAAITSVTAEDSNFVITSGNTAIDVQQTDVSWKITPPANVAAGSGSMTLTVTYNDGKTATATLTMTVTAAQPEGGSTNTGTPVSITAASAASATAGQNFTLNLTANGSGNLTWEAVEALPAGLTLSGSTISGKLDAAGEYTLKLKATSDDANLAESDRTDTVEIKVTVVEATAQGYTVTVENGAADKSSYQAGETVTIAANEPAQGKKFKEWVFTSSTTSTLQAASAQATTFTMPADNVSLKAVYEDITYFVDVQGGYNDAAYIPGTEVVITASPADGEQFKVWEVISGGAILADASSSTTTFIMPASDVVVKAITEPVAYSVTVENGTGDGSYAPGDTVTIEADGAASGKKFKQWASADVTPASSTAMQTTFTMPGRNVTIIAEYEEIPALSAPTGLEWESAGVKWNAVENAVK